MLTTSSNVTVCLGCIKSVFIKKRKLRRLIKNLELLIKSLKKKKTLTVILWEILDNFPKNICKKKKYY